MGWGAPKGMVWSCAVPECEAGQESVDFFVDDQTTTASFWFVGRDITSHHHGRTKSVEVVYAVEPIALQLQPNKGCTNGRHPPPPRLCAVTCTLLWPRCRGVEGTEEWKAEEARLAKALSAGADGEEGTRLVSVAPYIFVCSTARAPSRKF